MNADRGKATIEPGDDGVNSPEPQRASIETGLIHALERGELSLEYQPIIDAKSRSLAAVEALLRWTSPELGRVPADRFVPLVEDLQLTESFTRWVLAQASRELGALMARHPELKLSINLPAQEVLPARVQALLSCLADSGTFGPERLQMEITERTLLVDSPAVTEALAVLAQAGVSLAIDDFGTGYSSLSYLDRYPITCLKIDKSFVNRLTTNPRSRKLTEAIVLMAGALGVPAVAEGVEDIGQLAFLVAKGCRYIQGYLFARPLAIEQLEAFFAAFRFPEALLEAALWPPGAGLPRLLADNQEQALRLFVEHVPAAVAMFDPDMRYLAASARWIHDNKLGGQEVIGRSHYEIFPRTPSRWRGIYARCLAGAVERSEEDSYIDPSSKTQWLRWEVRPFANGIGDVAGIIVFCELITERKEAERRQSESEQLLADFLATAYDWLWETDADHRFFLRGPLSGAADAQASIDARWLVGSSGWGFDADLGCRRWEMPGVEPGQDALWQAHQADLAARLPFRDLVFARRTASGERVWREVSGQPVFGENGEFQGYRGTARDVTARVEAVQRHRESEQRLADYLATASDWMWESDADHRIVSVTGVEVAQWPGDGDVGQRRWELAGLEPGQDGLWQAHRADLEAHRPFRDLVYARRTATGQLNWREVSGRPIFDENGAFKGYRGTTRDVSARVAAENAVRTQAAQLELASEMAGLGHWHIDVVGQSGIWSPAVVRITGRDLASFAGDLDRRYEVLHPDDRDAIREEARSAAAARRAYEATGRIVRPDGVIRDIHLKARPEIAADGQLLGYFGIIQDITGRNAAAAEFARIARENQIFRSVIESLPDEIFAKDTASQFLVANSATIASFQLPNAKALIGKSDHDFHPRHLANRYRAEEQGLMQEGRLGQFEHHVFRNGETRVLSSIKAPLRDASGRIVGLVGMNRDITEPHRAQVLLEAKSKENTLYRSFLESLPVPVFVKDRYGRFLLANDAVAQRLGVVSGSELIGRHGRDYWPMEFAGRLEMEEQDVMTTGRTRVVAEPSPQMATGEAWTLCMKSPMHDRSGVLTGLIGIEYDAAELLRAQQKIETETRTGAVYGHPIEDRSDPKRTHQAPSQRPPR